MDFLWHKVSKSEQEKIKKEAKKIMDNFASELKKVKSIEFKGVERSAQLRKETKIKCDPGFRELFFDNVPKKEGNWLKAEKGAWKK